MISYFYNVNAQEIYIETFDGDSYSENLSARRVNKKYIYIPLENPTFFKTVIKLKWKVIKLIKYEGENYILIDKINYYAPTSVIKELTWIEPPPIELPVLTLKEVSLEVDKINKRRSSGNIMIISGIGINLMAIIINDNSDVTIPMSIIGGVVSLIGIIYK